MLSRYFASRAWLSGVDGLASDVLITVNDGVIAAVETDAKPPHEAVRLPGFVLPGLVNAHSHAFHRALRSRTHRGSGDFWSWREQMYRAVERLDPDGYRALARATYAEMALAGITTVCEFHYLHHGAGGVPYDNPSAMDEALAAAAEEAGIRLVLLDTCYLRADVDGTPLSGPQLRFGDRDADAWAERADHTRESLRGKATVGAAIHSVRACPPEAMRAVAAWADEHGAPLHIHLSEQVRENRACLDVHGRTPTGLCADNGVLGPRTTAVHATHLDAADIALLGGAGTIACFCPTTERDLADGIGPAADLLAAGAGLSLGSDSHAVIDLFEEARAVELNARLETQRRGQHTAADLLAAATEGGAAGAGHDGGIRAGAPADFIAVDTASVRTAGGAADPIAMAVFAATAADVTHVVRGGRMIVEDRRHRLVDDVAAELERSISAVFRD